MIGYRDLSPDIPIVVNVEPPEIYSDGIAIIEKLDPNFRITYFTWGRLPGSSMMVRVPVLRLIRPLTSLLGAGGGFGLASGILDAMAVKFVRH